MPAAKPLPVFRPLTPERWPDLVALFGAKGACGGCWCMWMRLPRAEYEAKKGAGTKRALKGLVDRGEEPGLVGYLGGEPVAWVSVGPRASFRRLEASRTFAPVREGDESPDSGVWAINCLFVRRDARGRGVSTAAIRAAAKHARARGAKVVEAFPIDPTKAGVPPVFAFPGLLASYRRAGFREVLRRSPTRPIVRLGASAAARSRSPR
jgi:GNAT superfamily N-acetyltransferase